MRACGDCHSNQTDWPFFSYVAPASWVISNHVWKARNGMNFHNWDYTAGKPRTPDQVEESIREGRMPPAAYLFTHPQARLTAVETEDLIQGLRATMEADPHAAAMFFEETGAGRLGITHRTNFYRHHLVPRLKKAGRCASLLRCYSRAPSRDNLPR
jgi:hypothetical protein